MNLSDLNSTQLDGIFEVDPTGKLCAKLLGIFEAEIPQLMRALELALGQGDLDIAVSLVHSIRSSSLNMGAKSLAEYCLMLEDELKNQKKFNEDVVSILKQSFDYTVLKIRTRISQLSKV